MEYTRHFVELVENTIGLDEYNNHVFNDFHNVEIVEDKGVGRPVIVRGEMQLADVKNANGRIYSESLWKRVLKDSKTKRRLENRSMVGELDHPESGKTKVERISHLMRSLDLQNSARKSYRGKTAVIGEYETAPTPHGNILANLHRAKYGLFVSSRGDGDVEESAEGSRVVPESYSLDTFDVVLDPSVDVALETVKESKSCGCVPINASAAEALINSIGSIMESGNYNVSDFDQYHSILESFDPRMLSESLSSRRSKLLQLPARVTISVPKLNEDNRPQTQEVSVSTATTTGLLESQLQSLNERTTTQDNQIKTLQQELNTLKSRYAKSEELLGEAMIRARSWKMKAEHYQSKVQDYDKIQKRFETAKKAIEMMREKITSLLPEAKLRQAAESLLSRVIDISEKKDRMTYIDRLLAKESKETQAAWKPILVEGKTRKEVNARILALRKAVSDSRNSRGLPPLNEDRRNGRVIADESPLLNYDPSKNNRKDETQYLSESHKSSVAMSRALVSKTR